MAQRRRQRAELLSAGGLHADGSAVQREAHEELTGEIAAMATDLRGAGEELLHYDAQCAAQSTHAIRRSRLSQIGFTSQK